MKAKAVLGVQAVSRTVVLHVALYLVSQTLTTQLPSVCKRRYKHQVLPSSLQPGNVPHGEGGEGRACLLLLPFHFFPLTIVLTDEQITDAEQGGGLQEPNKM